MNAYLTFALCVAISGQAKGDQLKKKHEQFARQAEASVSIELAKISFFPNSAETLQIITYGGIILRSHRALGKSKEGQAKVTKILQQLDDLTAKRRSTAAALAAGQTRLNLLIDYIDGKQTAAADAQSQKLLAECQKEVKSKGDAASYVRLVTALDVRQEVLFRSRAAGSNKARYEFIQTAVTALQKFPKNASIKAIAYSRCGYVLVSLTRFDYSPKVGHLISKLEEFQAKHADAKGFWKFRRINLGRMLTAVKKIQTESAARYKLIGKALGPLPDGDWIGGRATNPKKLQGKVVLLDFWGLSCAPCLRQLPRLHQLRKKYRSKGLRLVGISQLEPVDWDQQKKTFRYVEKANRKTCMDTIQKFAVQRKIDHPLLLLSDRNPNFKKSFRVQAIPQLMLVDRAGIVRGIWVGGDPANLDSLEALLAKLLK